MDQDLFIECPKKLQNVQIFDYQVRAAFEYAIKEYDVFMSLSSNFGKSDDNKNMGRILPSIKSGINYLKIAKSKNIRVFFNTEPELQEKEDAMRKAKKIKFHDKLIDPQDQKEGCLVKQDAIVENITNSVENLQKSLNPIVNNESRLQQCKDEKDSNFKGGSSSDDTAPDSKKKSSDDGSNSEENRNQNHTNALTEINFSNTDLNNKDLMPQHQTNSIEHDENEVFRGIGQLSLVNKQESQPKQIHAKKSRTKAKAKNNKKNEFSDFNQQGFVSYNVEYSRSNQTQFSTERFTYEQPNMNSYYSKEKPQAKFQNQFSYENNTKNMQFNFHYEENNTANGQKMPPNYPGREGCDQYMFQQSFSNEQSGNFYYNEQYGQSYSSENPYYEQSYYKNTSNDPYFYANQQYASTANNDRMQYNSYSDPNAQYMNQNQNMSDFKNADYNNQNPQEFNGAYDYSTQDNIDSKGLAQDSNNYTEEEYLMFLNNNYKGNFKQNLNQNLKNDFDSFCYGQLKENSFMEDTPYKNNSPNFGQDKNNSNNFGQAKNSRTEQYMNWY